MAIQNYPDVVILPTEHDHLIEVREPLLTKAPCPDKAQPYCCYANTVIFYLRPYVIRPWHHFWDCNGKRKATPPGCLFEEWDRVETRLHHEAIIVFRDHRLSRATLSRATLSRLQRAGKVG